MSNSNPATVKVANLRPGLSIGDDKLWYITQSDVSVQPDGTYVVMVRYSDGGLSQREWPADMGDHDLPLLGVRR